MEVPRKRWQRSSGTLFSALSWARSHGCPTNPSSNGGYAFISVLSQGRTIAAALDAATAADPKFDMAINCALLIEANVIIGIREQARTAQLNA